jgi:hypothetical protein
MDQSVEKTQLTPARLRAAHMAKGSGLEDLAIATGFIAVEIEAAEDELKSAPAAHVERIEHAVR